MLLWPLLLRHPYGRGFLGAFLRASAAGAADGGRVQPGAVRGAPVAVSKAAADAGAAGAGVSAELRPVSLWH